MKKYFAVKNVECADYSVRPGYFGKRKFATTSVLTVEDIKKYGFGSESKAFNEMLALAKIFGSGARHDYRVQEFDV